LSFLPGLHRKLLTPGGVIADPDPMPVGLPVCVEVETAPGDIVIFHSLAPHLGKDNLSEQDLYQLYFSYSAGRHGSVYDQYYNVYKEYVRTLPCPGGGSWVFL